MRDELAELLEKIKANRHSVNEEEQTYKCPKCKDIGWFEIEKDGHIFMRRCECLIMKEAKFLMEKSGVSLEFQSKGFKNFDTRNNPQLSNAKSKAIGYYQNFFKIEHTRNNSIIFYGQVGSGKTHLGTAICSNLMSQNVAVIYMSYRNTLTKIKQVLIDEADYKKEVNRYAQARVLYIDDLLKGRTTESDVNILYEIVNYRYMNNLPIIISTEKSLEELMNFDEAIGSRIIEMCRGNIIQLQGKELNYRLFS